jgi:hypothetical protein
MNSKAQTVIQNVKSNLRSVSQIISPRACVCFFFLLALPASTNYQLKAFEFGGGGGVSSSTNYSTDAVVGEVAGAQSSANYGINSGLVYMQNANVPTVTLSNPSSWYNKLNAVIGTQNNPSDTVYAIAISPDSFVTTYYVQSDNTIGPTLGIEDYQTYTTWGGASGVTIIGLTPNTTYTVKVKAMQGKYSESAYGPTSSAATSAVTLTFDIDVGPTDVETSPPYTVPFGSLTIGNVNTATDKIWIDLSTNAEYGGYVYVRDTNSGLKSTALNYTITSSSTNLASANSGYGIQGSTATGLAFLSPYNGSSDNIGLVDTTVRELLNSSGAPVTSGRASVLLKVKPSVTTPSASDYTDTLTLVASATF